MKRYNKGFTMLELLVTLAVTSIIVMIGLPSFQGTIRNSRITAAVNELSSSINLARSEAIKRNKTVVVRAASTGWRDGWQVFVDVDRSTNNDDVFNDDGDATLCEATEDCLLKVQEALPNNMTVRTSGTNFTNFMRYAPTGLITNAGAAGNSFYLCSPDSGTAAPPANTAKVLVLNTVGRPRMAVDSNRNGIPEIVSGTDITTCTP